MKTHVLLRLAACLSAALLFFCCKGDSDPAPGPATEPDAIFNLSVSRLTFESMAVSVKPTDKTFTYYSGISRKSMFDAAGGDNKFIAKELEMLKALAAENGVTLKEMLGELLYKGDADIEVDEILEAETDYYVYAYGLDADGKVLTEMEKIEVRTPKSEFLFNISVPNLTFESATLSFHPADKTLTYYSAINKKSIFDAAGGDDKFIEKEVAALIAFAEKNGVTLKEMLSELLRQGNTSLDVTRDLDAETDYCVYAYGLDTDGKVLTGMEKIEVTTPKADPVKMSDCSFSFDIQELTSSSYGIIVYPTDMELPYYTWTMTRDDYYLYCGGSEEGLKSYLENLFRQQAAAGHGSYAQTVRDNLMPGITALGEYAGIPPETDYIVYAVGMDSQGRFNTDVYMEDFTTLPLEQSAATVALEFSKYYDGTALANADSKYETVRGKVYFPLKAVPSADAMHWSVYAGTKTDLATLPDDILLMALETKGLKDKESMAIGCKWAEYMIIAAAQDENDVWGEMVKESITFAQDKASPISDIIQTAQQMPAVTSFSSVLPASVVKCETRRSQFVPFSETRGFVLRR